MYTVIYRIMRSRSVMLRLNARGNWRRCHHVADIRLSPSLVCRHHRQDGHLCTLGGHGRTRSCELHGQRRASRRRRTWLTASFQAPRSWEPACGTSCLVCPPRRWPTEPALWRLCRCIRSSGHRTLQRHGGGRLDGGSAGLRTWRQTSAAVWEVA